MTLRTGSDPAPKRWTPLQLLTATLSLASAAGRASVSDAMGRTAADNLPGGGRRGRLPRAAGELDTWAGNAAGSASKVALPRVSLMLSSYARPENVEHIVEAVSKYDVVDEILVWDVRKPDSRGPNITHFPKTSLIFTPDLEPMQKWGMLTRLKGCLLAQNEWVFFQDDDLMISEQSIVKLIETKLSDPDQVTCLVARAVGYEPTIKEFNYVMKDVEAPALVPICLPHAMLTDQRFCKAALRKAPMMEDVARQGRPYWSAEDIWHSLVAINTTSKMHQMVTTPHYGLKGLPAPHGIHSTIDPTGVFDWKEFRSKFTHETVSRLGLSLDLVTVQPQRQA